MKSFFRVAVPSLILATATLAPSAGGAEEATAGSNNYAEERHVLELDLARLRGLVEQDNDPMSKTLFRGYYQEYERRAFILFQNFDSRKYDELRYDINVHCQRTVRKLAPLAIPPPLAKGEHEVVLYQLHPSPTDAAEVKAAVVAADDEIARMENRINRMAIAAEERKGHLARFQVVKDRRADLGKGFSQPAWDALILAMKEVSNAYPR